MVLCTCTICSVRVWCSVLSYALSPGYGVTKNLGYVTSCLLTNGSPPTFDRIIYTTFYMKKTIFLLGTLLTASVSFAQITATAPVQEPQAMASAFFKAFENEDAASIDKLTTTDFAIINFDGQIADRDLLDQALGGGFLVVEKASIANLRSRAYGDNTAVVTGESTFNGSLQGTNFSSKGVFTVTCVKQGADWKIASAQLSGAAGK